LKNGTYQYQENGKVYNSGNWDYKDNGWLQISFYKWKDIPSFNLRDCKNSCLAIVTYDNGKLVFQPDDDSSILENKKFSIRTLCLRWCSALCRCCVLLTNNCSVSK
jgi:hypothetical protein